MMQIESSITTQIPPGIDPILYNRLLDEDPNKLIAETARGRWLSTARQKQVPPKLEDWNIWFLCCGRGFGKTRVGAEDLWWWGWKHAKTRLAVVGPTFGDCRDTCFEGESGLLNCCPSALVLEYNRSLLEMQLVNGTIIKGFTAEKPNKLRGPQHHRVWADEVGAWQYPEETLSQIDYGLRLGHNPQLVITTTPIPNDTIRQLVKDSQTEGKGVILYTASTFDNARNLAPRFIAKMKDKYEGTRVGRQELHAEILSDTPGALWTFGLLDDCRVTKIPPLVRIVVGVDPAMSANEDSDETGIIVAGLGEDGHGYILADMTVSQASPTTWATAAVNAWTGYHANLIVAEVNNGGDLVVEMITRTKAGIPVTAVRASVGKFARAEPISMLYEQRKVHHLGTHGKLETQMTTYVPGLSKKSPDRMDALVWALTELMPMEEECESVVSIGVAHKQPRSY